MVNVLKSLPVRKALREKGRSLCTMAAVFCTTVLFVTVFSTMFFMADAAEEMLRENSPILADAAFFVTDDAYARIRKSPRVFEAGSGIRLADMRDAPGAADLQLFTFDDQMARWMRCFPAQGRMPESAREIVVSDQYLRDRGLSYPLDEPLTLTYSIEGESYTDRFTVTGVYEMSGQPLHVILASDALYQNICRELERRGIAPGDAVSRMAGVRFSSRGNVRRIMSRLIAEEALSFDEGELFLNDVSVFDGIGPGALLAFGALILALMLTGYLFISNIFRICIPADARFYGRLSTNGVTKKEIGRIFVRQNRLLFLAAAILALLVGYAFASAVLPGIINTYTTLQVKQRADPMIFVLSLAFSYATVRVSERGPLRLAKNAAPIEMKKYTGNYPRIKAADSKSCLNKFAMRHLRSDRVKVVMVCISLALGILLSGAFYTIVAGFDEEEYVRGDLDADFLIAKKPVFTNPNLNLYSYERTSAEELAPYKSLPGIVSAGGGSSSHVCLFPSEEVWNAFVSVVGESLYSTPGQMVTEVYGLDDLLLEALTPIDGEIDPALFHTGNYVLLDPILSDDNTNRTACYAPGETVTIPFLSGEEKTYTVMAVVESLPYSLSLPGRYQASNLYLPREEWMRREHRNDYYMYAFHVSPQFHEQWDDVLTQMEARTGGRLAYRSAKTSAEDARDYTNGLKLAGALLSLILLSMGILNFINCTAGGIYSRRRELSVLQSMGLSRREIRALLIREGMLFMAGGFVPGALLSVPLVWLLSERLLAAPYIQYRFYPQIYLAFALLFSAAAIVTPWAACHLMDRRENFLERLGGKY